jgi:hypothetical protein
MYFRAKTKGYGEQNKNRAAMRIVVIIVVARDR